MCGGGGWLAGQPAGPQSLQMAGEIGSGGFWKAAPQPGCSEPGGGILQPRVASCEADHLL